MIPFPLSLWSLLFNYRLSVYHLWKINKRSYFSFNKQTQRRLRHFSSPLRGRAKDYSQRRETNSSTNKHFFALIKCLLNDKEPKVFLNIRKTLSEVKHRMLLSHVTTTIHGARWLRETEKNHEWNFVKTYFSSSGFNEWTIFFTSSWNIKTLLWNKQRGKKIIETNEAFFLLIKSDHPLAHPPSIRMIYEQSLWYRLTAHSYRY